MFNPPPTDKISEVFMFPITNILLPATPLAAMNLLLNDARGVYIPRDFITEFKLDAFGIVLSDFEREALADPSNDDYWEAWMQVESRAKHIDADGNEYTLYQNGDLWMVCDALLTEEERDNLYGEC